MKAHAAAEAQSLDRNAQALDTQGKQAGGFTGERLKVEAEASKKEAEIVKRQGEARAEATVEVARGQAKAIRSR